ncbi:hypothetical protein EDB86DRAFT_2941211 [Lactarius hatsudake]|nr:hypothetical protein EDB86DRAFT_2941211 [Lactarius hatsudake]
MGEGDTHSRRAACAALLLPLVVAVEEDLIDRPGRRCRGMPRLVTLHQAQNTRKRTHVRWTRPGPGSSGVQSSLRTPPERLAAANSGCDSVTCQSVVRILDPHMCTTSNPRKRATRNRMRGVCE